MRLLTVEYWPVHVICVGMIAAAVIDWWKYKVPNKLTFPLIISGWLLGLANNFGLGAGEGGIGAALAGTFLGMGLLLPVYAIGGMGAGDVKMTMGFGSWIGAFFGLAEGMWIIVYAFCAGTIVGGIIALGMIMVRGNYRHNVMHVREIVGDMFTSTGIGDVADKANKRRPRWHRLPYGVPLCIGFLGCLIFLYGL
ncbi:MAG: A24 family peptidase [Gemmataceae bacterium]|nr:A24 family peptidase [Gemmataceae bacterium]MCI0739123.1 A24 family peptidase [Gemmataceae bacterium]